METHVAKPDEVYGKAAEKIVGAVKETLDGKGRCILGIVGGRTAGGTLAALERLADGLPDKPIEVFWLDERVSGEKNYTDALPHLKRLSEKLSLQWHPFPGTDRRGILDEIAAAEERLEATGMAFDVVVLSAGEDGHVCSLFPRHPVLTVNEKRWSFIEDAPKPPPLRVSVTVPLLCTAEHAVLYFVGKQKKDAYERFSDRTVAIEDCPAKLVRDIPDTHVYVSLD